VWLVTCDEEVQLERLIGRGMEPTDAAARLAAQRGLATRLRPRATRVIDTSGSAEATSQIVERLLAEALAR